jgi:ABC-type branched-subunit amino acid transport system ATPase component
MLQGSELVKRFGAVTACGGVTIAVQPGAILALIGPNGAGKSTLINMLGGQWKPDGGRVTVDGRDVTRWSVGRRATRAGIVRTFQTPRVFPSLTVRDNVLIGQHRTIFGRALDARGIAGSDVDVERMLERFDLLGIRDQHAMSLPHGVRRRVELGRCLLPRPAYVLLDEPTAGLSPAEVDAFCRVLVELRAEGMGVLLVVHDIDVVMQIADAVVVLNFGEVIASGSPDEVVRSEVVRRAYLGTPA